MTNSYSRKIASRISSNKIAAAARLLPVFVVTNSYSCKIASRISNIVQELCESRGGRPGLSVLTSLLVSVDVKNY